MKIKLFLLALLFFARCGSVPGSYHKVPEPYSWQYRENICLDYPILNQENSIANFPSDLYVMLGWIDNHIQKVPDVGEYWQTSCETIERGAGDCEDLAILLWTLLKDYGLSSDSNRIAIICNTKNKKCHQVVILYLEEAYIVDPSYVYAQRIYTIESFFAVYPSHELMVEYNLYSIW